MRYYFLLLLCLSSFGAMAHPMPNSLIQLDIQSEGVRAEIQLPMIELNLALGQPVQLGAAFNEYLLAHVHPVTLHGQPWNVTIKETYTKDDEVYAILWMQPPAGEPVHNFSFHYDAVIAEVASHKAVISVKGEEVGIIRLDVKNNTVPPLIISQEPVSLWKQFAQMLLLGMQHIAEGTDHLLFLIVLLLPAPKRVIRIVTAFTIGHSITLLAGAIGWFRLPSQPVEVLIAVSILVSAIHAWKPIFPGKEAWVAAGFGLIHGLAFADTIAGLQLDAWRMGMSILGFNVGIELMQLIVILLVMPVLLWLSRIPAYKYIRVAGAVLAGIAATVWITERI